MTLIAAVIVGPLAGIALTAASVGMAVLTAGEFLYALGCIASAVLWFAKRAPPERP